MREHDAAARRMIVGGGVVLAAALAAVGTAAAVALRLDREAGREAARQRLREIVDEAWVRVGHGDSELTGIDTDAAFRPVSPVRRPFDPTPPVEDSTARFWLDAADVAESPSLARAALRLALGTGDEVARLVASHRLGEPHAVSAGLRGTREAVALGLAAGDPGAAERAWLAVGTEDDVAAAALLVGYASDDVGAVMTRLHQTRRLAADEALLLGVAATLPEREVPAPGGERCRAALLDDGSFAFGTPYRDGWRFRRLPAEGTARAMRAVLAPAGVRIVRADAPIAEGDLSIEVPFAHRAVWERPPAGAKTLPVALLAGLGVVALGAFLAWAAFVRAVRREARAAAARADFVATVSHELRTPVAVVRTSAETLLAGRAPREEDRTTLLQAIVRETERLSALLGNVLDFARIDAGTRRYAFRDVAVRDLVQETVRRTAPTLAAGGFRVELEIDDDAGTLRADPDALGAALANLLDNAAKYRGTGDRATVRVVSGADLVTIEVEDRGVGVPDAEKPHVFERFFRGADPRIRETRGSGIGLALVRHAVEAHGGRVEVRDTPGGGTTFRLVLPREGRA